MKKTLKSRMLSMVLVFVIMGTTCGIRILADNMVTELSVGDLLEDTVSENDMVDTDETVAVEPNVKESDDIETDEAIEAKDNEENIEVMGDNAYRNEVAKRKLLYPEENNIRFTLPDCGTWKYQQSYARKEIFNYINQVRMYPGNWAHYLKDNDGNWLSLADKGEKPTIDNNYVYDYNLEAAAMQRAAELALSYTHTRPDHIQAGEVLSEVKSSTESADVNPYWYVKSRNELLVIYQSIVDRMPQYWDCYGIVDTLMETNAVAGGEQEHRRVILTDSFYRIGIGCIKTTDGKYFVAIEVGEDTYEPEYQFANPEYLGKKIEVCDPSPAIDTYMPVEIRLAPAESVDSKNRILCTFVDEKYQGQNYKMDVGDKFDFGNEYFSNTTNLIALWKGNDTEAMGAEWYSTNENVAKVSGTTITAVGAGECQIISKGSKYAYGIVSIKVAAPPAPSPSPTPTPAASGTSTTVTPAATPAPAASAAPSKAPAQQVQKVQQTQTITVDKKFQKTYTVKKSKIKKNKKVKLGTVVNNGKAHGRVSYSLTKCPKGGKKYIKISNSGTVTLKKGIKKGTYSIKIAAGENTLMKKATKTVKIKVK